MLSFAALWISMSACIPTYMLASSLIGGGMNWWQAVLTIFLGNLIVLVPMILNAHAGTRYGIPFPVYCRAAFGTLGANVPAILARAGGVRLVWHPDLDRRRGDLQNLRDDFHLHPARRDELAGHHRAASFLCFLFFWGINMWVIYRGIETIRWLLNIKAPLLIALGLAAAGWAYRKAGGFGPILSQPSQFDAGQPQAGKFWIYFFPGADRHGRFWATLSLNIPDFSRYAKSQRDQIIGQALGLPLTMALVFVHRRRRDFGHDHHLRPDDLGSGGRADANFKIPSCWSSPCSRSASPRSRRTSPPTSFRRRTISRISRPENFLPPRRFHHRHHRHFDDAVETGGRSERLHFHLADRLQRVARPDWRNFDRRLFCLPPLKS
jgi:hypothetical protein